MGYPDLGVEGCFLLQHGEPPREMKTSEVFQGGGSRSEKGWSKEADVPAGELTNPDSS